MGTHCHGAKGEEGRAGWPTEGWQLGTRAGALARQAARPDGAGAPITPQAAPPPPPALWGSSSPAPTTTLSPHLSLSSSTDISPALSSANSPSRACNAS